MILVTGAAGKTGRALIQRLLAAGHTVRGLVRRREQAQLLEQMGVQETIVGDIGDPLTLNQAAKGVVAIYHICPNMHPQETTIGENIIRAAWSAGIARFVYHSVLHPQIEAMPHHWQKMRVEEILLESGLDFTILQPAAYMQNILANWDRIFNEGIYSVPYPLRTRLSMVDLQDVAEIAAKVLTGPGYEGAIFELCGSERLTQTEVAAQLSLQLQRPVTAESIPVEQWEQGARSAGLSDYAIETLLAMFKHYGNHDFIGSSLVLAWLLGRPPTTFPQFLDRAIQ